MTVKELKELLKDVPDNFEVRYEYDGPDSTQDIMARVLIVSKAAHCVLLAESE